MNKSDLLLTDIEMGKAYDSVWVRGNTFCVKERHVADKASLKTAKAIRDWVSKFEGTELSPTSIRKELDSIIYEIEEGTN